MPTFNTQTPGLWVLGLVLLIAMWTDMRQRKIPNALLLVASALALLGSMTAGGVGLASALVGGVVALLVFVVFYAIGAMGAGDVKLMATVGMFMGRADVVGLCITVLIAGGLQSLIWALWQARLQEVLLNTWQAMLSLASGGWRSKTDLPTVRGSMPYALAIGAGSFAHLYRSIG